MGSATLTWQMSRFPYPGNRKMWSRCSKMAVEKRPWIITALQCSVRKDIKYRLWERSLNTVFVKQTNCIQDKPDFDHPFFTTSGGKALKVSGTGEPKVEIQDEIRHFPVSQNLKTTDGWLQDSMLYQYRGVWAIGWDVFVQFSPLKQIQKFEICKLETYWPNNLFVLLEETQILLKVSFQPRKKWSLQEFRCGAEYCTCMSERLPEWKK